MGTTFRYPKCSSSASRKLKLSVRALSGVTRLETPRRGELLLLPPFPFDGLPKDPGTGLERRDEFLLELLSVSESSPRDEGELGKEDKVALGLFPWVKESGRGAVGRSRPQFHGQSRHPHHVWAAINCSRASRFRSNAAR